MRENPNSKPNARLPKVKAAWLLALGLTLAPVLSAPCWADNFNLGSVDFISNGEKTDIILHTGSIVPVQKVLVSNSKLILDIDQVNTDDTVRTNFENAGNISHVIMQPLSDHKVRMIIRGESLGTPTVAFYSATNNGYSMANPNYNGPKLAEETNTALHAVQEQGLQSATLQEADPQADAPLDTLQGSDIEAGTTHQLAPNTQAVDATGAMSLNPSQPAPTSARPVTEPLTIPANDTQPMGGGSNRFLDTGILDQLPLGKATTYLPYGLAALLMLGAGIFIRNKVIQMKSAANEPDELVVEEPVPTGKRASFREMADAYRSKHDVQKPEPKNSSKKHAEDMIGLRSLKENLQEEAAPMATPAPRKPEAKQPQNLPMPNTLESLLEVLQAAKTGKPAQAQAPAPKKQAVGQYLKNQSSGAKKPAAGSKPMNQQELLQRELQRAQEIQAQVQKKIKSEPAQPRISKPSFPTANGPVNRAPAARKNAPVSKPSKPATNPSGFTGQGPLPGNPEVLNFLRNVADLMEKDGKTEMARSIHKNLNANNLGMI